jgi:hypothetical protein
MSLNDIEKKIDDVNVKVDRVDKLINDGDKKQKKKLFKKFGKAKRQAKKSLKEGKVLVCYLKNNRDVEFFWSEIVMGLIDVDPIYKPVRMKPYHGFESGAVYNFKHKYPVVVIPEWRLLPVGGVVEDLERAILFGGDKDKVKALELKIGSTAEVVLANMMEKKELDASAKKKGNWGWLIWVVVGLVALYVIGKLMGWFN